MKSQSDQLALKKLINQAKQNQIARNETKQFNLPPNARKSKAYLFVFLIIFSVTLILILLHFILFSSHSQIKTQHTQESLLNMDQNLMNEKQHVQGKQKRRNLSVWTKNCCPTTQTCGIMFEDCCEIDTRGCSLYIFCYTKADDSNCSRVATIVESTNGYWAF